MPEWVVDNSQGGLESIGNQLRDSRGLLLGLAYKKNVNEHRESSTLELIQLLKVNGAYVDHHDFYIPKLKRLESMIIK